jgi:hypothetical protein
MVLKLNKKENEETREAKIVSRFCTSEHGFADKFQEFSLDKNRFKSGYDLRSAMPSI